MFGCVSFLGVVATTLMVPFDLLNSDTGTKNVNASMATILPNFITTAAVAPMPPIATLQWLNYGFNGDKDANNAKCQ